MEFLKQKYILAWLQTHLSAPWRYKFLAIILLLITSVFFTSGPAQAADSREYQIKAAFLFNFVQFVEWPSSAFQNDNSPICIGVLGNNPFGTALAETVRGETVHNRRFTVEYFHNVNDVKHCQLVFISKSEKEHASEILSELHNTFVLTVGEFEGFANSGGSINFYLEDNRVRFEINPASAYSRGIKLSSQLLNLAKIVVPKAPGAGN